jgi:hypothetical protein
MSNVDYKLGDDYGDYGWYWICENFFDGTHYYYIDFVGGPFETESEAREDYQQWKIKKITENKDEE